MSERRCRSFTLLPSDAFGSQLVRTAGSASPAATEARCAWTAEHLRQQSLERFVGNKTRCSESPIQIRIVGGVAAVVPSWAFEAGRRLRMSCLGCRSGLGGGMRLPSSLRQARPEERIMLRFCRTVNGKD